jgi:preprotein translocase subunit YajC
VGGLIVIVAMLLLLWVLLIRPTRQRQAKQQEMLASVAVGDEILTAGGLYGHVREVREGDELAVEIAPGLNVRVARRAVAAVMPREPEEELVAGTQNGENPS